MALEDAQILSTRNGSVPVVGYREDLAANDVVSLSLTSTVGVSSVAWYAKGRPESSLVGGTGPEPCLLSISLTASFTVDNDADGFRRDGTYTIEAIINPGSPGEVRRTAILARLSGLTIPGPSGTTLQLRKMGGFESLEDTEMPNINQGWKTQAIRWLEWSRQNAGGGGGGGVLAVVAGPGISITGTASVPIINNTGVLTVTAGTGISITGTGQNPIVNNTGVLSVSAGPGISVTGTAQNPIVNNTGVLSVTAGTNVTVTGTAQNPVINATGGGGGGVASVSAGPGISITGTSTNPIVNNTGVLSITAGANIVIGGTAQNPVISSTGGAGGGGIVQVIHAGPGISVTGTATDPIINNTGVLSVSAGPGISITGTAQDPIVNNTGVLSVTAGTNVTVTGTAQNPVINAAAAAGGLFYRTNLAGLVAINDALFTDPGSTYVCRVGTVGDYYQYAPGAGLTPDGITVLNSFAGLGQWFRMNIPNPGWLTQKFWSVGAGGSDEAQGCGVDHTASDAVRLATMAELNRRLTGYKGDYAGWYPGFSGPSIHLTSDVSVSMFSVLTNLVPRDGNTFPKIWSTPFLVDGGAGSRTITGYQAAVPSTNTERRVTIAGLGSPTQYVGKAIINAGGTKFAWVTRVVSANVIAISQPRNGTANAWFSGGITTTVSPYGATDFTVGEVVGFYDVRALPDWPYPPEAKFPALGTVAIANTNVGYLPHGDMGNAALYLYGVRFGSTANQNSFELFGGWTDSGGEGFIVSPLFTGSHVKMHGCNWFMYSPAVVNADAHYWDNCNFMIAGELNITSSGPWPRATGLGRSILNLPQQNSCQVALWNITYLWGAFLLTATDHHGGSGCDFWMDDDTSIYGAVPGALFAFPAGTRSRLYIPGLYVTVPGAVNPGGIGAPGQLYINSSGATIVSNKNWVPKQLSDLPINDLPSGCVIAVGGI